MGSQKNKHGRSRYIPERVKRQVRQECGFGCVVCGLAFYTYEHFDPEWADMKEPHNPDGMALLCSTCNTRRRGGSLSKETVARMRKNPKCKEVGHTRGDILDIRDPEFVLGNIYFTETRNVLALKEQTTLRFDPPEQAGGPWLLSAKFQNTNGHTSLWIDKNELKINADNWDFEVTGCTMIIRNGIGDIALELELNPPSYIKIKRLNVTYDGVTVTVQENKVVIKNSVQNSESEFVSNVSCTFRGARVGIQISDDDIYIGRAMSGERVLQSFSNHQINFQTLKLSFDQMGMFEFHRSNFSMNMCQVYGRLSLVNSTIKIYACSLTGGFKLTGDSKLILEDGNVLFSN